MKRNRGRHRVDSSGGCLGVMWAIDDQMLWFLPRCMECRRGLAMRILSVCLSVRQSR